MVRARVLNCVDGVNNALLQKAINEQRSFFRERECKQDGAAQPKDATWQWHGLHSSRFPGCLFTDWAIVMANKLERCYVSSSWLLNIKSMFTLNNKGKDLVINRDMCFNRGHPQRWSGIFLVSEELARCLDLILMNTANLLTTTVLL